ncbi:UDP-glucuronosyl/UDP-glucosyltransferase [Macleaya cordata]|uniref:Glycosyltransferase n=1 Tax=Macleaya cordata TaxID=56857 RepID=A0A200PN40_MACCD|nr:UDP-glucuronosyl/UDP-glucosyltransferase [Macleaya cordata]
METLIGATEKPHTLCLPFPAQGHINPMMQLAKLLHSRGFHITFVNTEFNHRRFLRSKGCDALDGHDGFRFETIPDGLPPSDRDATQDIRALCESTRKNCLAPLVDLVKNKLNSSSDIPQVSCIISDGIMSFGIKAAEELGVPGVQLWTASACGFMGCLHLGELVNRGLVPLKDENCLTNGYLDTVIDWISGMKNLRLKDIPGFIRTTNPNDIMLNFMGEEAYNCLNASAIIFNTFDVLENEVLDAISSKFSIKIYTIGPLSMMLDGEEEEEEDLVQETPLMKSIMRSSSLWKEDSNCLLWLDKKEPNSVLYVNFGSFTVISDQRLKELAWGLVNSNHTFLWIIRPDVVTGYSAILPEGFFDEITKDDRGFLTSWCPQDRVLSHPAIGGFLTHCGWNSMLESLCNGVPMICWPFYADQQTNCRYACDVWRIGVEVDSDAKREKIERIVKELMEGKKTRDMALMYWKGADALNGHENFQFKTIPDGLPPSDRDATQDVPSLCDSLRKNCLVPFLDLVKNKLNSSPEIPLVSCIISDGSMSFGVRAAEELGVPGVQFWTASVCGFMGFLHYHELIKKGSCTP